jgi:3-keto-disaccharide hydrolase
MMDEISMKIAVFITALLAFEIAGFSAAKAQAANSVALFDGKALAGWIDQENNAGSFSGGDIKDLESFAKKLTGKTDAVSAFLNAELGETVKAELAAYSATNENAKTVRSALAKNLNKIISQGPVYEEPRFKKVRLRPETKTLLGKNPQGQELARLNKLLLEDAYPVELAKGLFNGWTVMDGAIASTGAGRGTLYTKEDFSHFRLTFLMRHVSGKPDHQACVLIFCRRPKVGEKPLDALGGIQFQVPNGGHWDYRPGHNNSGKGEFTTVTKAKFDVHEWSQIEILANARTGTARMAVAQPPGSKAVEVLDFEAPDAGRVGPIALQMHNAGLFDEYKDIRIEADPAVGELITVK